MPRHRSTQRANRDGRGTTAAHQSCETDEIRRHGTQHGRRCSVRNSLGLSAVLHVDNEWRHALQSHSTPDYEGRKLYFTILKFYVSLLSCRRARRQSKDPSYLVSIRKVVRMRTSANLGLITLVAASFLYAAVSTASARNLSLSNQNIRATWRVLEYHFFDGGERRCPITLEGSFHARTVAKIARALIGSVTRVSIVSASCTGGTLVARDLPWHLTYEGFRGTLPRISAITTLIMRFRVNADLGGECEYGTATDNISLEWSFNEAGEASALEPVSGRNVVHRVAGSFIVCPSTMTFVGSGAVTLLGTSSRVRITLI
jgi:hypothetical protein